MDVKTKLDVILRVVQQQEELIANAIMKLSDDNNEFDSALHMQVPRPRTVWMVKRYGMFWEKDVPVSTDDFFKESFRMERSTFSMLVDRLKVLQKKDTNWRSAIPLQKRIAIAMYTLGSALEYRAVGRLFGVSPNSVCNILHEFFRAVVLVFTEEYLSPNYLTSEKIDECVQGFESLGFSQCFGAIDGCHIEVKPLAAEAVDHYNYKGWYSIVLHALVDYRYRFTYVNIGSPGRCNDSSVFRSSALCKKLETTPLLEEGAKEICGVKVPVVLIADSAFRFSRNMMKPYPFSTASLNKQIFRYRLSKARRVIENAFGHLKGRFRRIGKGLESHPKNNKIIVLCCCIWNNILNAHNSAINETWKVATSELREQPSHTNVSGDYSQDAEEVRSAIAR